MLIEHIKKHYDTYEEARRWDNGLRGSNSGKCTRAIAYQYHGFDPKPLNWRARLVFRLGDVVEEDLVEVAVKHGLTDLQKEVSVSINGVVIKGHIDGILDDMVVDIKSCADYRFKSVKKTGETGDYVYQLHFYMKALGLEKALVVWYNKNTSDLCETYVVWDQSIWDYIEKKFTTVLESTKETLPDRDYGPDKKGKLPWQCQYCSFCEGCWDAELSFNKAGKPVLEVKNENKS